MKQVYDIIQEVAATSSLKEKQAILEKNRDNECLKLAFLYTENRRFNFWQKVSESEIKLYTQSGNTGTDISENTFNQLNNIIQRKVTGDAARMYLQEILFSLNDGAREIICRIVNKDLRCNCGTSIANKVWKNLIPEYPVMLASKYDTKAEKYLKKFENNVGFIVQNKEDGGRMILSVDYDGNVYTRSRNGGELNLYGQFDEQFKELRGFTFDGELLVYDETGKCDRKTGNGFYTRAVRDTLTQEQASKFRYVIWDMIPNEEYNAGRGTETYETRLTRLLNITTFNPGKVAVVESVKVKTIAECLKFYDKMRERGEEGAIIKVANMVYEDKRSKNLVKLKAEESADLLVTGFEFGNGQFAGQIGSLICTTSCGQLVTNVGSGLSAEDRARDPSYFIGKIVELKYNEVIKSKNKETASLFLPVYVQVRFDKTVANSLEELK